jgi:ribosomal protein S4
MTNYYKPRYKKCYRVKNKIWINKNSKLRGFYILRKSRYTTFRRKKLKSMKWNIVRRFLLSRKQIRANSRFRYKILFQNKQKIKYFYGKIKEYQLQQLFKSQWAHQKAFKQNIFQGALEKRLDVILYRAKFFPTIFATHQFISHQGVYINNNIVTNINYNLKCGDIISIQKQHWPIIYGRLKDKLIKRSHGHKIIQRQRLKKLIKLNKKKRPVRYNFNLIYEYYKSKGKFNRIKKFIKQNPTSFNSQDKKLLYTFFNNKLKTKFTKIEQLLLPLLKNWRGSLYFKAELEIILLILAIQKYMNKFLYIYKLKYISEFYAKKTLTNKQLTQKYKRLKYYLFLENYKQYKIYRKELIMVAKILLFKGTFLKNYKRKVLKSLYNKKTYKEKINSKWQRNPLWYIPSYLEIDYKTLRISFLYNPLNSEVVYPFTGSLDNLATFYKNQGLR